MRRQTAAGRCPATGGAGKRGGNSGKHGSEVIFLVGLIVGFGLNVWICMGLMLGIGIPTIKIPGHFQTCIPILICHSLYISKQRSGAAACYRQQPRFFCIFAACSASFRRPLSRSSFAAASRSPAASSWYRIKSSNLPPFLSDILVIRQSLLILFKLRQRDCRGRNQRLILGIEIRRFVPKLL